ncbi:MAG TPA: ABC transporter substrate-binding protein [Candidatus Limnocylindrales bacterium]|nr:ABC transporter substrate-binding protein [Candidatus Limnocylindrales bacterium]
MLLLVTAAVAGCGGSGSSPSAIALASAGQSPGSTTGTQPSASPASYPLTLTDDEGTQVTIPTAPRKIVSLTPATTEILFAIGLGPKVVGRTEADDFPAAAATVETVASFTAVDVEKIVGLGADLVIAGGNGFNPPDSIAKLRSLGIPVVVVYAKDVRGVLDDIRLVGRAAGAGSPAADLATSMAAQFDAVRAATAGIERPLVFYEIDASSKIYTAADDSFLAEMITIAGGQPLTTGSTTSYEISLEKLVSANPAVILLGDTASGVMPGQVAARAGWGTIAAVISGSIYPVDDVVITRPGPRLVQGLVDLVRAIHPELGFPPLQTADPSLAPATPVTP